MVRNTPTKKLELAKNMKHFNVILLVILILSIMAGPQLFVDAQTSVHISGQGGFNGRDVEKAGKEIGKGAERVGQSIRREFRRWFG